MPNRILKETICTSEEVDALSLEAEVFFYRLMVVVDDFGLMDARPAILKARCYPLKSFACNRIQALLDELHIVGLVGLYASEGRPYLHMTNWEKHQSIRAKKSKYPIPQASDFICKQMQANVPVIQSNPIQSESNPIQSSGEEKAPSPHKFSALDHLLSLGVSNQVAADWIQHRKSKRATCTLTVIEGTKREAAKAGLSLNDALAMACANGWQGFKAEWVTKQASARTFHDDRAATIAALTGSICHPEPLLIEGERI